MRIVPILLLWLVFFSGHAVAQDVSKDFSKTYQAYNRAFAQGDMARAAELAQNALDLAVRDIGADHQKIPILQVNLAHALVLQRRIEEAEPILKAARDGIIRHYGKDDLNLVTVHEDMARILASKNEIDKSRAELDKAIALIAKKHGDDHPQIAELYIQQAQIDLATKNIELAGQMYAKALAIVEKKFGKNSIRAAGVISQQGDIHLLKKDFKNAEQKYISAHNIYVDHLLPDDAIVLASHARLARLYIALRDNRFASHADTVIKHSPDKNGPAVPMFVMRPKYPIFKDGTKPQGWALLEFTVNKNGRVLKPRVMESKPGKVFDKVSLDITPTWRFKPKVVEGKRVTQENTRVRLVFKKDNIEVYFGELRFPE